MYCRHCGRNIEDGADVCPACATAVGEGNSFCSVCGNPVINTQNMCYFCFSALEKEEKAPEVKPPVTESEKWIANDGPCRSFWWAGFWEFPVGFVLHGVFKNRSPKRARSALNGAIFGLVITGSLQIILNLLYAIVKLIAG